MDETPVVTVFLRNRGDVLLLRRSDAVGSYPHRWGAVAGHLEDDPDRSARREIREETGIDPDETELLRTGDSFRVADEALDRQWVVHPYLFDCPTRAVETNWETERAEWVPPTSILDRETVPELWTSYDRVRPTVETVASDADHGSAYISLRALEALRDEAALVRARSEDHSPGDVPSAAGTGEFDGRTAEYVQDVARALLAARPSMTVVSNRIHRVMGTADTPAAIEETAIRELRRARRVDSEAADNAARLLDDARVATLSRSGTVLQALEAATPEAVLVAESHPGREGVTVAERLAGAVEETHDTSIKTTDETSTKPTGETSPPTDETTVESTVTLTTDAAFGYQLAAWGAEILVVGADSVLADGRLLNKVGTRGAAIAAKYEGVRVLVVTASDKISPETTFDLEARDPAEIYQGPAEISVVNPTFDLTPTDCIDAVVTERGELDSEAIEQVATEYRNLSRWVETGDANP